MTESDQLYIVVGTGWRGATHQAHGSVIEHVMLTVAQRHSRVLLRHGQCPFGGVDLIMERLAVIIGWRVQRFPAQRDASGRLLGPQRNRQMCQAEPLPDLCLAFPGPGSRGTWDCMRVAARLGIPGYWWPLR